MFKQKKTDPIEEGIVKTTFTLEEIRENYVPRKAYRRAVHHNWIMDLCVPILAVICLIVGFSLGVSSGVTGTEIARQSNAAIEEAVSEEVAENLGDK